MPVQVVAIDGNPVNAPKMANDLFIAPGARMQVIVQFPNTGTYDLKHLAVDTGSAGDVNPAVTLAQIVVQESSIPHAPLRKTAAPKARRPADVAVLRTIDFEEDPNPSTGSTQPQNFYICGETFDAGQAVTAVTIPDGQTSVTEQWTILNHTEELHVFHIHQATFQVQSMTPPLPTSIPYNDGGSQETITVPAQVDANTPGQVVALVTFNIPGTFVYHCHILGHEDGGMMATICVADSTHPCKAPQPPMQSSPLFYNFNGAPYPCSPKFPPPVNNSASSHHHGG